MGLIQTIFGSGRNVERVGDAVERVAEVFVPNKTKEVALSHGRYTAALQEFSQEFKTPRESAFDHIVNGLNRLPRPFLALGTLALFAYAMADPAGFSERMVGLSYVPEPLWWLLGAIVSFYFGARELHYQRVKTAVPNRPIVRKKTNDRVKPMEMPLPNQDMQNPNYNAALEEWRRLNADRAT